MKYLILIFILLTSASCHADSQERIEIGNHTFYSGDHVFHSKDSLTTFELHYLINWLLEEKESHRSHTFDQQRRINALEIAVEEFKDKERLYYRTVTSHEDNIQSTLR